jgi:RNA polymerase sigma-70 factor (ECF subfamily)
MFVAVRARINAAHWKIVRAPIFITRKFANQRSRNTSTWARGPPMLGDHWSTAKVRPKWAQMESDGQGFADALAAARRGESSALSVLYREFQPPVLRFLRAREPQLADDLASETWVVVAQKITVFDGDRSAFAAWLFTIARYRLADYRRTSSRRRTQTVAQVLESSRGDLTEQVALDQLSTEEAVGVIARVLSTDQAEVIMLRVLGDLSIAQVAQVMGRDVVWVGVTQHRALKRLACRFPHRVLAMR